MHKYYWLFIILANTNKINTQMKKKYLLKRELDSFLEGKRETLYKLLDASIVKLPFEIYILRDPSCQGNISNIIVCVCQVARCMLRSEHRELVTLSQFQLHKQSCIGNVLHCACLQMQMRSI